MRRDDITEAVVRRLLVAQAPQWADLPIRPVARDGWDNRTFRLGDELSVRLPSHDMYTPQVDKEHSWLPVLGPQLPVAVPRPVFRGRADEAFPRPWSVYRWLPGEPVDAAALDDGGRLALAHDLAGVLRSLQAVDASGGPAAGRHSSGRGGRVGVWDTETRAAIARFGPAAALAVWEAAVASRSTGPPVWVHGDVSASNLLAVDGRLTALIDFGCCAVGDPACDLVAAWTMFTGASRQAFTTAFRTDAAVDEGTWARARGWALWKAIVTLSRHEHDAVGPADWARRFGWRLDPAGVVEEVVAETDPDGR